MKTLPCARSWSYLFLTLQKKNSRENSIEASLHINTGYTRYKCFNAISLETPVNNVPSPWPYSWNWVRHFAYNIWISTNSILIYIFLVPKIWQNANVTSKNYAFFLTESQYIFNLSSVVVLKFTRPEESFQLYSYFKISRPTF